MTTKTRPAWLSGFCNPGCPPDSHDRCRSGYTHPTHGWTPCSCTCHTDPPPEDPMPHTTATLDPPATLTDALAVLESAVRAVVDAPHPDDWQDAVRDLARLRDSVHRLGQIDRLLTNHIYLAGEHGKQLVEGVGEVMVARSRDRRQWDAHGIAAAIIDERMADRGGEEAHPADVAEWLLEVLAVSYARVTPLRAMGLDPDAFCSSTPGTPAVSLPRPPSTP